MCAICFFAKDTIIVLTKAKNIFTVLSILNIFIVCLHKQKRNTMTEIVKIDAKEFPEQVRLKAWVNSLSHSIILNHKTLSNDGLELAKMIAEKRDSFISWAISQIENK